jgi:hypothetical protein
VAVTAPESPCIHLCTVFSGEMIHQYIPVHHSITLLVFAVPRGCDLNLFSDHKSETAVWFPHYVNLTVNSQMTSDTKERKLRSAIHTVGWWQQRVQPAPAQVAAVLTGRCNFRWHAMWMQELRILKDSPYMCSVS